MAVDDIALVRVVGRYQSQNIVNNLYYQIVTQNSGEDVIMDLLCNDWDDQLQSDWLDRHIDDYQLIGIRAFSMTGDPKPPGSKAVGQPGNVVGTPQESFVCRTITLYPLTGSSKHRGRVMLSGGVETMFADLDGSVTPAEITLLSDLGDTLIEPLAGPSTDAYQLIIFNRTLKTPISIIRGVGRPTPSITRSRRIRQFSIG